jgi:Flp pilus assembly protein TadG
MRTTKTRGNIRNKRERGTTLVLAAVSIVMLLALSALGIDLATLYVTRNEAQRASDAAALAAAKEFVTSGYTSGLISQAAVQPLATSQAKAIGGQNNVGGQPASIQDSDVTFDFSQAGDPRVSVKVIRAAARGNAVPTFFGKIFGVLSTDVAASATAEAYNPSGSNGGPTFCTGCVKPFILPNCDLLHANPANPVCPGGGQGYYIQNGQIVHPGPYSSGGVIGEPWTFHSQLVPSQYGELDFNGGGDSAYRQNIASCNTNQYTCGDTIPLLTGKGTGPTGQGIQQLIHASGYGPNQGQDTMDTTVGPPFQMYAGSNNPLVLTKVLKTGDPISSSDSVTTVPVYDGSPLNPGSGSLTIIGYMQIFINYVDHHGTDDSINAYILNVAACQSGGSCTGGGGGGGGTVSGGGQSLIPVRLVRY